MNRSVIKQKTTASTRPGNIQYAMRCACAALLLAVAPATLGNTTNTWNNAAAGTYSWSTAGNWSPSAPGSGSSTTTVQFFNNTTTVLATPTYIITNDDPASLTLNALNLEGKANATSPGTTVYIGTAGNTWTFDGSTPTINLDGVNNSQGLSETILPNLQLSQNVTFTGSGTAGFIFNGLLSGSGTITKSGSSTLKMDGNSTSYAGAISVSAGTLQIGNATSGSASLGTGTITLSGSGSFMIRKTSSETVNNTITGTTTGTVSFQPIGTVNITYTLNKANTYTAPTTLTSGTSTSRIGTLKLGIANGLPTTTVLTIGNASGTVMTFDLGGYSQTLNSLVTATGGSTVNSIVTTSAGTPTLTISGTTNTTYAGLISGNLSLVKGNTNSLTLASANTYTGNTTINGGTLALGVSGSINNTPQIIIGAGGTLDVSAISAFSLGSSTLTASGTTNPATIKGNASGTVNLGSQSIALTFDGTNAPLTVAQGQLVLNGNAFTVNASPALAAGDYTIITNVGNTISSSGTLTVSGTAISGTVPSVLVSGGAVVLHLVPAPVSLANSTLVSMPTNLPADNISSSTVTVTVNDNSNTGISGLGVTWTVSGSGNVVNPAGSGFTDGSGQFSFTVKSVKSETKTVIVNVGAVTFTNYVTFTNPASPLIFTWDPLHNASGSDGAGTWDTSTANWANNGVDVTWPNNGTDAAVLGTGASLVSSYVVSLATPVTVANLTFNTLGGNQYQLIGQYITLSNTPVINVAANALISSPLSGSGFVKDGAGTLRIDGDDTNGFAGNITVSNGLLQIGNNGAFGSLGTGTITVVDPGVFTVRRQGILNFSNSIAGTFSSAMVFQLNSLNSNAVVTLAKTSTYNAAGGTILSPTASGTVGTLKLGVNNALPTTTAFVITNVGASAQRFDLAGFNQAFGSLATTAGGSTVNSIITNSVSTTTSTLTIAGTNSTTYAGALAGNIALVKGGSNTLTLAANTYTGNTTINGGTLELTTASLATTSTVSVANGAALQLDFAGTNQVAALVLGGTNQSAGVYSSVNASPYLTGSGSLVVVPTIATNPTNITANVISGNLVVTWPADHIGWILQSQTNSLNVGLGTNWVDVPGSASVNAVTNPVVLSNPSVFYRLRKP